MKQKFIKTVAWLAVACLALIATCDIAVKATAHGRTYDNVNDIPHNRVGLLLGTNPTTPRGTHNYYYTHRINAAAELFHAGKVDYLLISGDNSSKHYDEPTMMRDSLLLHGVPADRIVLDYAGFRTLDSVIRAKEVFGQSSFTIISQKFHNERALVQARHYGIDAIAYNADDVILGYPWLKVQCRERLARVKLYLDLLTGKQPKFLGEKVNI
ncbi:MAG: YdcF family protein [Muribaculaceae bacterium]|nr:YdcF family protein [Muribaculaceae bacterium]